MSKMELFFDDASMPRYWSAGPASATQVTCSAQWPPVIAVAGYAPCLRAWQPTRKGSRLQPAKASKAEEVQFSPVECIRELDGHCFVTCAVEGDLLAAATAGPDSKVVVWCTDSWRRLAVLQPGCAVACLALSGTHVAAGTAKGTVHVWRRLDGDDWAPLFQAPLQLDTLAVHSVSLSIAPDGQELLLVHSRGKNAVGVWRLTDGKLVHRLEMRTTGEDHVAVTAANMVHMRCEGPVMAGVSHVQGEDPVVQLMHVLTREGEVVDAPDRLRGRGQPLCCDFDGALLAVGCADGALVTFGYRGWLRWHRGAVGAVHVMRGRMQVLSGCAGGELCLWDAEGRVLAAVNVGFQVSGLAGGDLFAVTGGNRGELQIAVLPYESEATGTSEPARESQPTATCIQYEHYYDLRPAQPVPYPMQSPLVGCLTKAQDDIQGCFAVPHVAVTAEHFQQLHKQHQEKASEEKAQGEVASSGDSGKPGSGFDMTSALKGAQRTEQGEEAAREAIKKQQLKQMGEGVGVARSSTKVVLPSSVELLGRKCDSLTCLVRQGATAGGTSFSRCGGCKRAWYCSVHCQRTHWRDAHSKQCKEWQKEQQKPAGSVLTVPLADTSSTPSVGPLPATVPATPTTAQPVLTEPLQPAVLAQPQATQAQAGALMPSPGVSLCDKVASQLRVTEQSRPTLKTAAATASAVCLDEVD